MKKLITCLLLYTSTMGFSQNCENSILDTLSLDSNVNDWFPLVISMNQEGLSFLDDCDSDMSYTMFVPGDDVPASSLTDLMGLDGVELIDILFYYIYPDLYNSPFWNSETIYVDTTITMMDENPAELIGSGDVLFGGSLAINDANIINPMEPICACNGLIYIIDDLILAPGLNLAENEQNILIYPNPTEGILNVSKIIEKGVLEIRDITGKVVFSKEIKNQTQINTLNYKKGIYLVSFKSNSQSLLEIISIN